MEEKTGDGEEADDLYTILATVTIISIIITLIHKGRSVGVLCCKYRIAGSF